jgi:hypothetical protein
MSFQAYIDNIKAKTGKSPDDFIKLAWDKGFLEKGTLKPTVKAGQIVEWLKNDFQLGLGHAMAIYTVFKQVKQTIVYPILKQEGSGRSLSLIPKWLDHS